ncbi:MAG: mannose-6-phosphate isomerase [Ruminococcaceae bacterium]|nr:mannose-6-phosphate isomerase [Oscillospiraceae bacterium]
MLLKLKPIPKDYIWGGSRLVDEFDAPGDSDKVGELWMLSCHPDHRSRVDGGVYDGKSLPEVLTKHTDFMGTHAKKFGRFPLMVKLIHACDDLSIQVHPDDEYAADTPDKQGKTELWYVIDAEPDAEVVCGLSEELNQDQFRRAIQDGTFLDSLQRYKVKAGDVFFIEAGTIHSIGKGVLLAEIEQNSTTAYRIYDHGRVDEDGQPRPLRIDRAIDVAITVPTDNPPGPLVGPREVESRTETVLGECDYFRSVVMETFMPTSFEVGKESFASVIMLDGKAVFMTGEETMTAAKGESLFISAGTGRVSVTGKSTFIVTTI